MTSDLRGRRVAVYARYSSQLQRESSIEDQVRRCTDFVARSGGTIQPELIFADMAVSGASLARPGFERLMRKLDELPPGIDMIVTEDVSRISRDFADAASIFQRLKYLDVALIGVADGVDTSAKHAKLTYTVKSLVADLYLDDLRDKTLRGLEGRALAGYSTGGLPYGYRSVPVPDDRGGVIGHRIELYEEQARVVRRIFAMYLDGKSLGEIARTLTTENVSPPRALTRHRKKGWIASTIRAFLHNDAYIGNWSYKKRQWRKAPGTNARRPKARDESEVMRMHYAERRIVDQQLWDEVQIRLAKVRAYYTGGVGKPGKRTSYPFSGLFVCGRCGAQMVICGGSSTKYYRCADASKRGTCDNHVSLREDVARARILGTLKARLTSEEGINYLRKRIAQSLNKLSGEANAELEERHARLTRTENRIARLVQFIADGNQSDAVRSALKDLEAQARADKTAVKALRAQASLPIELPGIDAIVERALDIQTIVDADPTRAREELGRWFDGGHIKVTPQPGDFYIAEAKFLPLMMLGSRNTKAEAGGSGLRATALGCAGAICALEHAVFWEIRVALVA